MSLFGLFSFPSSRRHAGCLGERFVKRLDHLLVFCFILHNIIASWWCWYVIINFLLVKMFRLNEVRTGNSIRLIASRTSTADKNRILFDFDSTRFLRHLLRRNWSVCGLYRACLCCRLLRYRSEQLAFVSICTKLIACVGLTINSAYHEERLATLNVSHAHGSTM